MAPSSIVTPPPLHAGKNPCNNHVPPSPRGLPSPCTQPIQSFAQGGPTWVWPGPTPRSRTRTATQFGLQQPDLRFSAVCRFTVRRRWLHSARFLSINAYDAVCDWEWRGFQCLLWLQDQPAFQANIWHLGRPCSPPPPSSCFLFDGVMARAGTTVDGTATYRHELISVGDTIPATAHICECTALLCRLRDLLEPVYF
jgi:hypothetical protein